MNHDLTPSELLTLMEAYTQHRVAEHHAAGNGTPLDQTELLLHFRAWVSGMRSEALRSILKDIAGRESCMADDVQNPIAAAGPDSLERDLAILSAQVKEALSEFLRKQPGSRPVITIDYGAGDTPTGQPGVLVTVERPGK